MKIRSAFVSNSSTSSFLIYGVMVEMSDFKKAMENKIEELNYPNK